MEVFLDKGRNTCVVLLTLLSQMNPKFYDIPHANAIYI
jgi:hypothetical protein